MGFDYVLFHCTYNIPLSMILSFSYGPFCSREDVYKILILISIAVTTTVPWDSYLIRNHIWSYPPSAVLGYTVFDIPVEEIFFFVIQTYNTSLLYCMLTKTLFRPIYIKQCSNKRCVRNLGITALMVVLATGIYCLSMGPSTYLGLILVWVCPFLLLQWTIAHAYLVALPWKATVIPVCLPTLYLWFADLQALSAGTWVIETESKLGKQIWGSLEIEEAIFFFLTNLMIVVGLTSWDYVMGMEETEMLFSDGHKDVNISVKAAVTRMIQPWSNFDKTKVHGLESAVMSLYEKSQSMFLGSALFPGRLRFDLIFLYSFCRKLDDIFDEPGTWRGYDARHWIKQCTDAIDARFRNGLPQKLQWDTAPIADEPANAKFEELLSALELTPMSRLPKQPFHDLLSGFQMDLEFDQQEGKYPIRSEADLDLYAYRVAGTIGVLLLELVYHQCYQNKPIYPPDHLTRLTKAGAEMGKALQYVNIARDIRRDAAIGRVYIPTTWLNEVGLTPSDVIRCPTSPPVYEMQKRMLALANKCYEIARPAISELPNTVRKPVRATVESYMEIGKTIRKNPRNNLRVNKLKVPFWRRLIVAWWAMF